MHPLSWVAPHWVVGATNDQITNMENVVDSAKSGEPKFWFTLMKSPAEVPSDENRAQFKLTLEMIKACSAASLYLSGYPTWTRTRKLRINI